MQNHKYLSTTLKLTSLFLFLFTPGFLFIIYALYSKNSVLNEGAVLGYSIIRRLPYQWDFELIFAAIFLVWSIFLWKASKKPEANKSLIFFTIWAFIAHNIAMFIIGLIRQEELMHLSIDSMPYFILAFALLYFIQKK